jgi:hypothetical protein
LYKQRRHLSIGWKSEVQMLGSPLHITPLYQRAELPDATATIWVGLRAHVFVFPCSVKPLPDASYQPTIFLWHSLIGGCTALTTQWIMTYGICELEGLRIERGVSPVANHMVACYCKEVLPPDLSYTTSLLSASGKHSSLGELVHSRPIC